MINENFDRKGRFLSFEGIEGSGKTTQIKLLEEKLMSLGFEVSVLREPGGTEFGEGLRQSILQSKAKLHPITEAHLFCSSRSQLLYEKIIPFLEQDHKNIVIVDRFIDSSLAYQGMARGLGIDTVLELHKNFPLTIRPQRTFYLSISAETSLQRQNLRGEEKDYFEKEKKDFTQMLIAGFEQCSQKFKDRFIHIDGEQASEHVHHDIIKELRQAGVIS